MRAQRIAGTVAVIAAAGLLVLAIVSSVAGLAWTGGTATTGTVMGPGMMSGFGSSMMGGAVGPGMMGGGMGPGHMGPGHIGPGHMGFGYGTQGAGSAISGAPTVTVTATDFRVSPTEITLASAESNLTLVNEGSVVHDLTIPALGVRVVAGPGQTTTVGLRDLPAGRYAGSCSVPGHAELGMQIAVVVQ